MQKYVSSTNHTFTQNILLVSKKFWDRLSPDEQRMMREADGRDARLSARADEALQAEKSLAELKAKGMAFNEIAPAEHARMREATKPVAEKFLAEYDQGKVKLFNSEMERVRKAN